MKLSLIISFLILAIGVLADLTTYVKGYYQPTELKSKYEHFGGCPSCHLEKRPKSECGHETQGWAWDECVRIEHLHPN